MSLKIDRFLIKTGPAMRALLPAVAVLVLSVFPVFPQPAPEDIVSVVVPEAVRIPRGGEVELGITVELKPGWHINSADTQGGFLVPTSLTFEPPEFISVGDPIFPEPVPVEVPWAEGELELYEGNFTIRVPLKASPEAPLMAGSFRATISYQACSGEVCLPPTEKSFEIPFQVVESGGTSPSGASPSGESKEQSAGGTEQGPAGPPPPDEENPIAKLIGERGILFAVVVVFALGLGLNLTPCVYPMVPITVAYFGGMKGARTRTALISGLAFVFGLSLVYSGLGIAAAATGRLFGEALQRPWVLWIAAGVMVAMALSFFGLYHLRAPAFITRRIPKAGRGGILGAFVMGAFAGVVAAPCVGPATVALLSYVGMSQDLFLGGILFFALSLGFGSPYVILALFSHKLSSLPRSGVWTVWVERLLGFVLLGLALYFLSPSLPQKALPWIAAALALAGAAYLGTFRWRQGGVVFKAVKTAVGLGGLAVAVLLALPQLLPAQSGAQAGTSPEDIVWVEYKPGILDELEGKPVFIYFDAAWCAYCRKMKRTTFADTRVIELLRRNFHTVHVDLTTSTPINRPVQMRFYVRGVPTMVVWDPERKEIIFYRPGYIGPDELLEALNGLLEKLSGRS